MKTSVKLTLAVAALGLALAVQAFQTSVTTGVACGGCTNSVPLACGGTNALNFACGGSTNSMQLACGETNKLIFACGGCTNLPLFACGGTNSLNSTF